jgi:hypothetical protein
VVEPSEVFGEARAVGFTHTRDVRADHVSVLSSGYIQ